MELLFVNECGGRHNTALKATPNGGRTLAWGDRDAHPRPRVLGASARDGREAESVTGELLPPLLYSTELARSVKLCYAAQVRGVVQPAPLLQATDAEIKAEGARTKFEPLDETPISTDLRYGLINVRTDGTTVLCAYMKENGNDFDIKAFKAGVEPS